MECPKDGQGFKDYIAGLSIDEAEKLFQNIEKQNRKCWNPIKQDHLELSWKDELSEDKSTLKYEESESGMFYETHNILEYIQDCRYRKQRVPEAIRDNELIPRDQPQKLFLWISDTFLDRIDEFADALNKFLTSKSSKKVDIHVSSFENKYIIMTNVIVDGYEYKIELLKEFQSTLDSKLSETLSVYFDNEPNLHERIPSVANEDYKHPHVIKLVNDGYRVTSSLLEQIKTVAASQFGDEKNVVINIHLNMIGCTINNFAIGSGSDYSKFVNHILADKPGWFTPNEWLPKSILVEKFNEMYGTDVQSHIFIRNMNSEGLMEKISEREKRSRVNGKIQSVFLCKNI